MHGRGVTAYIEVDQRENRGADDLSITTVSPGLNKTAWGGQLSSKPTVYVGTSRLCELSRPETILNNMGSYDIYLPIMRPDFVYTCLAQIFKKALAFTSGSLQQEIKKTDLAVLFCYM